MPQFLRVHAVLSLLLAATLSLGAQPAEEKPRPRNLVLCIGDGMGLAQVAAASYQRGGEGLFFEQFPIAGYVTTHSANSLITDSAAAATAMASGVKTNNGVLGMTPDGARVETILEMAHARGLATGLVTSVPIGHATPAGFYAHAAGRRAYDEIMDDFFRGNAVDVLLGGGIQLEQLSAEEIAASAEVSGHRWMTMDNQAELDEVAPGDRLLGFFDQDDDLHLAYAASRETLATDEPRLVDLTLAALAAISADPDGFFLMVEGGAIDWAGHDNQLAANIGETLEFDHAIEELSARLAESGQLDETLIVVTADHETGGLTLTGPYGSELAQGSPPQVNWASGNHTATPVMVWARGPGAEAFTGRLDNTDLFRLMREALLD